MSTFTARYTTDCDACDEPIRPGATIRWTGEEWIHADCQPTIVDDATREPDPCPRCWLTHGGECDR